MRVLRSCADLVEALHAEKNNFSARAEMEPVLRLLKSSKLKESAVEHPQQRLASQTRRRWRLELNFGLELTVISKLWQLHANEKLNKISLIFKSDIPRLHTEGLL